MKNIVIIILSSIVSLFLAEVSLTILYPVEFMAPLTPEELQSWEKGIYQKTDMSGLSYELKPSVSKEWQGIKYESNEYGQRHGSNQKKKRENVIRIAALGDSYAFGYGLNLNETFTWKLQEKLNRDSGLYTYEVLNFGVPGYASLDVAAVVAQKLDEWDVDLILYNYCYNDAQNDWHSYEEFYTDMAWWRYFHLTRLICLRLTEFKRIQSKKDGYMERIYDINAQNWWDVQRSFVAIADHASEKGIPVMLVYFPEIQHNQSDDVLMKKNEFAEQVLNEAEKNGFTAFNIGPAFEHYSPQEIRLSEVDDHPSSKASDVIADFLYSKIKEELKTEG